MNCRKHFKIIVCVLTFLCACVFSSIGGTHVHALSLAEQISNEINSDVNGEESSESEQSEQNDVTEEENDKNEVLEEENDEQDEDTQTEEETESPDVQLEEENDEQDEDTQTEEETESPDVQLEEENDEQDEDTQTEEETESPDVQLEEENDEQDEDTQIEEETESGVGDDVLEENDDDESEIVENLVAEVEQTDDQVDIALSILPDIQASGGKVLGASTGKNKAAMQINETLWLLLGVISFLVFYAYLKHKEVFFILLISLLVLQNSGNMAFANRVTAGDFADQNETLYPGDTVRFKIIYQNFSDVEVEDVRFEVPIPTGTTYIPESIEVTPAEHDITDHELPTFTQTDAEDSDVSEFNEGENSITVTQSRIPMHSHDHGGTLSFEAILNSTISTSELLEIEALAFVSNEKVSEKSLLMEVDTLDEGEAIDEVEEQEEQENQTVQILTESNDEEEKTIEELIAEDAEREAEEDAEEELQKMLEREEYLRIETERMNSRLDREAEKKLAGLNRRLEEAKLQASLNSDVLPEEELEDKEGVQNEVDPYVFEKEVIEKPHKFPSKVYMGCLGYNASRSIVYTDNDSGNASLVENMSKFYINLPDGKKYYPLSGYGAAPDAEVTTNTVGSDDPLLKGHLSKILVMLRCSDFPETLPPEDALVEFTDAPLNDDIGKFIYGAQRLKIVLGEGISEDTLEYIDSSRKVKASSGLFKPVNKAEAISMIFRTIQLVPKSYTTNDSVLSEELRGQWFSQYFSYAIENGIAELRELKRPGSSIPRHLVFKITVLSIANKMEDPRWQFDWKDEFLSDI